MNLQYGFTEIEHKKNTVVISHCGNMGHSISRNVKPNVDILLGHGMFEKLRAIGKEAGSPDYAYSLTIPNKEWYKLIK